MNFISFVFSLFGEKKCLGCKKSGHFFCLECNNKIQVYKPYCYVCKEYSNGFNIHEKCYKDFPIQKVIVLTRYRQGSIKRLIKGGKYYGKPEGYSDLIIFHKEFFRTSLLGEAPGVLLPIPMCWGKKMKRGYNQAEYIAHELSQVTKYKINKKLLKKVRNTEPQAHLTKSERESNLEGVFNVKPNSLKKDTQIYLIDDVISTGSTLIEATSELRKSGFVNISAIVLASD